MDAGFATLRDMSRDRKSSWKCGLWLPLAVALVWWPVLFGGRTIARSELATTHHPEAVEARIGWPVNDSLASARQDECWLVLIRNSLAEGSLPLVNPDNGLGAPLLESLQPGVLYPLNVLLLAFDPATPWMFDAFCLIHMLVLVTGLAVLFARDTEPRTAVALAILFGLAGVSYQNVNMVHFRGFVWLPWMLACVRGVLSGTRSPIGIGITGLIGVTFCSLTAGNLQDAFVSLVVTGFVGLVELVGTTRNPAGVAGVGSPSNSGDCRVESPGKPPPDDLVPCGGGALRSGNPGVTTTCESGASKAVPRPPSGLSAAARGIWLQRLRLVALLLGLGTLGAPVILPHLIGVANGDLATVATPDRITEGVPLRWMSTWLLPHVTGAFPHQLLERNFWYLPQPDYPTVGVWLVVFGLLLTRMQPGTVPVKRACAYGLLATLALLKTCDTPLFDWLTSVPIVGGLKFHKYNLFVTVLLGSIAAMGLEAARQATPRNRSLAIRQSLIIVTVAVTGLLLYLWRDRSWGVAHAGNPAIQWFVLGCIGVSILTTLASAWIVHLGGDRIGQRLALLWTVHSQLLLPGGWLPRIDRYEDPVEFLNASEGVSRNERLAVTPLGPNNNLLFDRAELGVFDPVLNRRYREFHLKHFDARYADFALHQETAPRPSQRDALVLAGVTDIARFPTDSRGEETLPTPRSLLPGEGPWTEPIRVVPDEDVESGEDRVRLNPSDLSHPDRPTGQPRASVTRTSRNAWVYALTLPRPAGQGWRLVFRRAYSQAWQAGVTVKNGDAGSKVPSTVEPYGDLFCSVRIPQEAFSDGWNAVQVRLSYWPPGLTTGLWLLPAGVGLVVLAALGLARGRVLETRSVSEGLSAARGLSVSGAASEGPRSRFGLLMEPESLAIAILAGTVWLAGQVRPCELMVRVDHSPPQRGEIAGKDPLPAEGWSARLETIDGYLASGDVRVLRREGSQRPVVLRGWIVHEPTRGAPLEVRVQIGDRWWNATPGLIREDRPAPYADSSFRLCGFLAPLPPEGLPVESTRVSLWTRLKPESPWVELETEAAVRRDVVPE